MEYAGSEKEASERLNIHFISVWEDCDAFVADGIRAFRDRWANYSVHSKRKDPRSHLKEIQTHDKLKTDKRPIGELILEVLDPKVSAFLHSLPMSHLCYFPNPCLNIELSPLSCSKNKLTMTEKIHHQISLKYASKFKEDTPLTNLVMMMGFKNAHDVIKDRLRHFMKLEHQCRPIDFRFQATVDNLLELLWQLHLTPTHFKRHSPDTKQLNKNRKQTVCELCGNRNELAEYFYKLDNNLLEPEDEIEKHNEENPDNKKKLQLSHRYCSHHRPKSKDGLTWNSTYKSAIKSKDLFEKEYRRLQLHIVKVEKHKALSEDDLVDLYFYHFLQDKSVTQKQADAFFRYVSGNFKYPIELNEETSKLISEIAIRLTGTGTTLGPGDDKALRNIARRMVDSRLTDNKKKMLTLRKQGLSQKEIANKLTELSGKKITHQAVSKSLSSVRDEFLL